MKQHDIESENKDKDQLLNIYLRVITDYLQVISTIMKIKVNFIYGVGDFVSKFSFISDFLGDFFSFFYPLQCLYNIWGPNNINAFYANLYLILSIYPIILLINTIFWVIRGYIKSQSIQWITRRFSLAIFLISYLVQPSFINAYFKYLNCINIGEKLFLKNYLVEQCWVGNHLFHFLIFIMPSLVFWMIGYPCLILYLLKLKMKRNIKLTFPKVEKNNNNNQMLSFFTDGLKEDFYYWEILLMFRKYVFIILSIFPLKKSLILNLWFLVIFSFVFLYFQVQKKPYVFSKAVSLSLFTNIIVLIAILGLTVLYIENNSFNQVLFLSIFVILNSILFLKWLYEIYKLKKNAVISKIESFKKSIGGVFLKKNISSLKKSSKGTSEFKVFKVNNQILSNFAPK